ncbi:MAG TPA: nuclease-related domain-containing protein [archaeon]|nr:nuclease-related domain-containing protein [archaeon]
MPKLSESDLIGKLLKSVPQEAGEPVHERENKKNTFCPYIIVELEEIRKHLASGKTLEEALEGFDWKEFEQAVEEVFRSNDYRTLRNFRFKTKRRYEIDIIAIRGSRVFCVDCKEWDRGRYKKSGLKMAVSKQEERLKEFLKYVKANPILKSKLKLGMKFESFSLIVTLLQEDLAEENGTLVVPIWKLNNFLIESEKYL